MELLLLSQLSQRFLVNQFLRRIIRATFEKVKAILTEQLGVDENAITENTAIEELGADSLDVFQIIMGIEEEFDIQIPEDAAESIVTVSDAVEQIKSATN